MPVRISPDWQFRPVISDGNKNMASIRLRHVCGNVINVSLLLNILIDTRRIYRFHVKRMAALVRFRVPQASALGGTGHVVEQPSRWAPDPEPSRRRRRGFSGA